MAERRAFVLAFAASTLTACGFELATKQPTIDQPIEQLTERYTALSKTGAMTGMNKRIVDARLTALKMRAAARDQLVEFKKSQEANNARQRDLQDRRGLLAPPQGHAPRARAAVAAATFALSAAQVPG